MEAFAELLEDELEAQGARVEREGSGRAGKSAASAVDTSAPAVR